MKIEKMEADDEIFFYHQKRTQKSGFSNLK